MASSTQEATGKTLIIAEKPSVAADIARALGGFARTGDFMESEDFVLSSAVGHLVEIAAPEKYEVKRGKWSFANLPVIPPHFDLNPIAKSEDRLRLLTRLIKRKDVTALVNACDKFVYTEILCQEGKKPEEPGSCKLDLKSDAELIKLIKTALDAVADEDGWAHLGGVGQQISIQSPSFDARNYGFKKLGELVRALDLFEIDERTIDERGRKSVYIRHRLQRRPLKNRPARSRGDGRH